MSNLSTFYPAPITAADLGLGAGSNATFGSIQNTPIGSTTASSGTFTTLNANGTGSADLVAEFGTAAAGRNHVIQIWGNGAGRNHVITALGATGLQFSVGTGASGCTILSSGANIGFRTSSSGSYGWSSTSQSGTGTSDLFLWRDAANTLAQYNSTNPQTFRLYNTYTDASNYERGFIRWSSNVLQIGTEAGGTGSARTLALLPNGTNVATWGTGDVNFASTYKLTFNNRLVLNTAADGNIRITNWAENGFGLLQFGGTTSSFPALKRSSTTLQVRLADDSAFAPLESSTLALNNGTVTTSTPALTVTQTLNSAGTTFRLVDLTFTNTASSTNSEYISCSTGGTQHFALRRSGTMVATEYFSSNGFRAAGNANSGGTIILTANGSYGFSSSTTSAFTTNDLFLRRDAAGIFAQYDGVNAQAYRLYNTVSGTNNVNFERANLRWASNEFIIDAEAGGTGTSLRGIKIGSATSSLLGFYGATPVDRPDAISAIDWDSTGDGGTTGDARDVECRIALHQLESRLQELGLIA